MRDEMIGNMGRVRIYMNPIARIHTEQSMVRGVWHPANGDNDIILLIKLWTEH